MSDIFSQDEPQVHYCTEVVAGVGRSVFSYQPVWRVAVSWPPSPQSTLRAKVEGQGYETLPGPSLSDVIKHRMGRESEFMGILLHKLIELIGKVLKAVSCSALCDFGTCLYRWAGGQIAKYWSTEWPKKCIYSLLINIFGINLNEISISVWECNIMFSQDGTGALIIFAQQMAQALLAGADVLKCVHT